MEAVHAAVFPLDAERTSVTDVVKSDDDFFKVDVTASNGAEVPVAASVTEVCVTTKDTDSAVTVSPPGVLHVRVMDAITKLTDELHVVHTLVTKVRWIVVEAKAFVSLHSFDCTSRASDVEGDFSRMNFESEVDVFFLKRIEDRTEAVTEINKALLEILL